MITAAILRPGNKEFVLEEINTDLSSMQKLLGGIMQRVVLAPGIIMWVHEEAKIMGEPACVVWQPEFGGKLVLCGTIVVTGREMANITKAKLNRAKLVLQPIG